MESHVITARRIHLAFAAAGIIAAAMLAVTVKVGQDMASYFEATVLTTADMNTASAPGYPNAAPQALDTTVDPAIAAAAAPTVATRNEDAADLRLSDRTVAAAP
ncbi:hypothetical protein ACFPOA_13370 [Lysobacter niabensis]|uniref:hypothetical protein n=1 Tax=Agrilutibacter niabensis TaxID=380628 RepID=UPI0036077284